VVHGTENDPKQHLGDANDDREFHLERVQERNLVLGQLPHLTRTQPGRDQTTSQASSK